MTRVAVRSRVPPPRGRNPFSRRARRAGDEPDGRRGRVHDEHERLPGGLHRSVVSRTDRRDDRADDRQLRRQRRRSRIGAAAGRRRRRARAVAHVLELARRRRSPDAGSRRRKFPLSKALIRDASRDTSGPSASCAASSQRGDEPTREALARARRVSVDGRPRPRVARHDARSGTTGADPDAPYHIVAYDFGIKRNILRLFAEHGLPRDGRARRDAGRRGARARAERRVSLEWPGRSGGRVVRAGHGARRSPTKACRFSGSAWGIRSLGSPTARNTVKMPYGHRGGNHPVKEIATGRVLITSQNHGFAVAGRRGGDSRGAGARGHAREPERRHGRGAPAPRASRSSPSSTIRRPRPAPHDARPLFDEFLETVRSHAVRLEVGQTLDT